jgi:hypothetical protein
MAGTATLFFENTVLDLRFVQVPGHYPVTAQAESFPLGDEHVREIGRVRIVASVACLSGRLVFILEFELSLTVKMALEAEVRSFQVHKSFKWG